MDTPPASNQHRLGRSVRLPIAGCFALYCDDWSCPGSNGYDGRDAFASVFGVHVNSTQPAYQR